MPIRPEDFVTGGALAGDVAASLLRARGAAALPVAGQRVGPFRILSELGRGGMAAVFRAERDDGEYRQAVALKWIAAGGRDATTRALFLRERQALADLVHPNIARLLDGGHSEDGQPWLAMELVEGERIDAHARRAGLDLHARLRLFLQVCDAVAHAHARGLLHRDIKPSNVLVDARGQVKLLDFGIAQLIGEEDTLAAAAHTPGFASPEQIRGERLTVAADVYQLGRLLQRVLAPSDEAAEALTRATVMSDAAPAPAAPAAPASELPRELAAVVTRATAADCARRYASATALGEDIAAFLSHRPVAAMGDGAGYRLGRFVRRHRVVVAVGAIALAVLLGTALVAAQRVRTERDTALRERATADAINRFLNEDLLDAANPLRRAPDEPDMTVRQALDAAEGRIEARFGAEPRVAARVLQTLGMLRYEFGEFDRALALLDAAVAKLPEGDPQALRVRLLRASVMFSQQRLDEGAAELDALQPTVEAAFGAESEVALELRQKQLHARGMLNSRAEVIPEMTALSARARRALGSSNLVSAQLDLAVADAHRLSGRADLAEAPAEAALAALIPLRGPDHPSTLKARVMLGHALNARGETERAVAMLREAVALQRARFGADDGDSLFMQNELAFVLASNDRFEEAEPLFEECVALWSARWGRNLQVLPMMSNLGGMRVRLGRPEQGLQVLDDARTFFESFDDAPAFLGLVLYRQRIDALRELGRLDQARAEATLALELAAGAQTPDSDLRLLALKGAVARVRIAAGELEAGLEELRAARDALEAQVGARHALVRPLTQALEAASARHAPAQ